MRKITLGHLDISPQGRTYVNDALDNNRLSSGKYTQQFESLFAARHSCQHGIFMNSGTSALQVALAALKEFYNYKDDDEVIVPATTFIATSNVVIQNNLKPVFVDVRPDTFNIDPTRIFDAITSRTRCIMPVHLFGLPADMRAIMTIANNRGIQVLEDSCETVLSRQDEKYVGSFGDIACFSTYIAHLIVGGVGGVVTTNNDRLAELCRSFMAHGRDSIYTNIDQDDSDDADLRRQMIERRFRFERVGYSYRCTEMEAAIALSELERADENILIRRFNAKQLMGLLSDLSDKLQLPVIPEGSEHSFMMFPMVCGFTVDREKLLMHLEENGIETRLLFPLLSQPIYRKLFPNLEQQYPIAQHLAMRGFYIGSHQGVLPTDLLYISNVLHEYFEKN